jgi:hypothetical protein
MKQILLLFALLFLIPTVYAQMANPAPGNPDKSISTSIIHLDFSSTMVNLDHKNQHGEAQPMMVSPIEEPGNNTMSTSSQISFSKDEMKETPLMQKQNPPKN